MKREETVIKETIKGLRDAPAYVSQRGEYKYDRVSPDLVENAIILLQHYDTMLEAIKSAKRRLR